MSDNDESRPDDRLFPDDLPEGFTVPDDLSSLLGDPVSGPGAGDAPAAADAPTGDDAGGDDAAGDDAAGDEPAGVEPGAAEEPSAGDQDMSAPGASVVPDDLSSLEDGDEPPIALVVTQVAGAGPLAAACSLATVEVDVVMSPVGALAVLRDPKAAPEGAAAISKLLKTVPVILLERRAGQVVATRWTGGERGDELAPGLVLSDAPEVLEDLILGAVDVQELDGVVTSVGMSRWKAMRLLASSSRDGRRSRD